MKKQIILSALLLTSFSLSLCTSENQALAREKRSAAINKAIWGSTLLFIAGSLSSQRQTIYEFWDAEKPATFWGGLRSPFIMPFTIASMALYGFAAKDWYEARELENEQVQEQTT